MKITVGGSCALINYPINLITSRIKNYDKFYSYYRKSKLYSYWMVFLNYF